MHTSFTIPNNDSFKKAYDFGTLIHKFKYRVARMTFLGMLIPVIDLSVKSTSINKSSPSS